MKIGILGAGITGLTMARLLASEGEVEVLEKKEEPGGLARTRTVEGATYHTGGGHCFNSKYPEVLDFVFGQVLPREQWRKIQRKSCINLDGHDISYPIEFAVKEIYNFDSELAYRITRDFLTTADNLSYTDLEDWFRKKFGHTLAEKYFIPYNRKIWNREPATMDPVWVQDKLPIPDRKEFFAALMEPVEDDMPHAHFHYPLSNNQNCFIDALSRGTKIECNYEVKTVGYDEKEKVWTVNGERKYDLLISTIPLNLLIHALKEVPEDVREAAVGLKYNSVSNVFWKSRSTDKTWTYFPDASYLFHRYIHIGSFWSPQEGYTITETIGRYSYDEMKQAGCRDHFLLEALDYHVEEYAYVVYDNNYKEAVGRIREYLNRIGMYSVGRFGEWQYYNMDVCMKSCMDLRRRLLSGGLK